MSFFVIAALQCDRIKGPKLQRLQRLLKLVTKMFKSLKTGKVKGEGLLCKGSCEGPGISRSNCQHLLPHCHPHPSTMSLGWRILCFVEEIVKEAEVFLCLCFVGPEISCPIVNRIFHVTMVLHPLCHLAEGGFALLKKL